MPKKYMNNPSVRARDYTDTPDILRPECLPDPVEFCRQFLQTMCSQRVDHRDCGYSLIFSISARSRFSPSMNRNMHITKTGRCLNSLVRHGKPIWRKVQAGRFVKSNPFKRVSSVKEVCVIVNEHISHAPVVSDRCVQVEIDMTVTLL